MPRESKIVAALSALVVLTLPFQAWHFLTDTALGHDALALLTRVGRYAVAHGTELAGLVFALVVVPLVSLYVTLRAMVDVGDWLDLKVQQWRAERFRKSGW